MVGALCAAEAQMPKKQKTPEDVLRDYEDKIGVKWATDRGGPTRTMWDLWDEAPCYLQIIKRDGEEWMVASKAPLTREQVREWNRLEKAKDAWELGDV
jgi:hypothetical protein